MSRPLIAISIAKALTQTAMGYGTEHLAEALVRIARLLLRSQCNLAYGGDLQPGGFTELLLRLVRAENTNQDEDGAAKRPKRSTELRRLVSYLAWPRYGQLTADHQARYLGVCRFVRVPPPGEGVCAVHGDVENPFDRLREGLALSAMRRAMALGDVADVDGKKVPAAAARLVLGGKVHGYSGLMPGILEEVAWALRAGTSEKPVPVFVLGGFGGAAEALAKGFLTRKPPPELTLRWHESKIDTLKERLALLASDQRFAGVADDFHPAHQYELLADACAKGVSRLARLNGLAKDDNERLLTSSDLTEVLRVIAKAKILEGGKRR